MITRAFSSVALLWALGGCASGGSSRSASLQTLPAPVQETIRTVVGEGKLDEIRPESEGGVKAYEVEYVIAGSERSATILEDGSIVEEETELSEAELPAPVRHAVSKAATDWKIGEVMRVNAKGQTYYEVDVRSGDQRQELKVSADGTILSKSAADDDDDDGDDDDDDDEDEYRV